MGGSWKEFYSELIHRSKAAICPFLRLEYLLSKDGVLGEEIEFFILLSKFIRWSNFVENDATEKYAKFIHFFTKTIFSVKSLNMISSCKVSILYFANVLGTWFGSLIFPVSKYLRLFKTSEWPPFTKSSYKIRWPSENIRVLGISLSFYWLDWLGNTRVLTTSLGGS